MSIDRGAYAIAGLGVTEQGMVSGATPLGMQIDGLRLAMADAGLRPREVDGYVYQPGILPAAAYPSGGEAAKAAGMSPRFVQSLQAGGTSAITGILYACAAIDAGIADVVAVGYGDALRSAGALVGERAQMTHDNSGVFGMFSPGADHALAARRHMHTFGTTKQQLGGVALAARQYANLRPDAFMHNRTLDLDEYLSARPIADPLSRYDYCLTADGGCAVIVTSADRARDCPKPAVEIAGLGLTTSTAEVIKGTQYEQLGLGAMRDRVLGMADIGIDDIDVAQIYDCFTMTVLLTLEGWGFCKIGESGPFVEDGNLLLDGSLPTNTAGGELSWSYMQGFTPLCEAVRQLRGESGATQVAGAETCLVTGHGKFTQTNGFMEYCDAGMILQRG
jgi:acetyl-CoA acetyltransferase